MARPEGVEVVTAWVPAPERPVPPAPPRERAASPAVARADGPLRVSIGTIAVHVEAPAPAPAPPAPRAGPPESSARATARPERPAARLARHYLRP